jgi:hypothetical protein
MQDYTQFQVNSLLKSQLIQRIAFFKTKKQLLPFQMLILFQLIVTKSFFHNLEIEVNPWNNLFQE